VSLESSNGEEINHDINHNLQDSGYVTRPRAIKVSGLTGNRFIIIGIEN